MGYTLNFAVVWANMPKLLEGLLLGLELAVASLIFGTSIGLVGGFLSVGSSRAGRVGSVLVVRAPPGGPSPHRRAHELGPVARAVTARAPLGHEITQVGPTPAHELLQCRFELTVESAEFGRRQ